ncbi:MAG: TIGR03663 family protein [Chloroflexota bacterium]|nr:TIGR03663 family protein [Chloroflexota bacterium]
MDKPLGSLVTLDWEKGLYIIIVVLALTTRLWGLGDLVPGHDESVHAWYSWNLYTGRGFAHSPWRHGPFLYHATALSYFLFDDNEFTARLPVALMGVALVAFPYLLRRWLGRAGALATSFLLLISPSIAYYSRYIRHDIPITLWSLVVLFAIFSYLRDGRDRWLYLMAAGVSLMFATKEVSFIYNAIFGFFLVGLFAMRVWRRQRSNDVFDLIIVLGTLCLPFLSPILIQSVGLDLDQVVGLDSMDLSTPTFYYSGAIVTVSLLVSAAIGLLWDRRRWSIAAVIHYAIFVVLFTTFFTNGTGIASGLIGSLGYWWTQQEVERGSQPGYYYVIMALLYEYLPLLLTFITAIYLVIRPKSRLSPSNLHYSTSTLQSPVSTLQSPFIPFLLWWTALSWIGYSYAGERMPWMTVHLAVPMILLSGWLIGRLIEGADWRRVLRDRTWLLIFVTPPFVLALVVFIQTALSGPFQGYELASLGVTGRFLSSLVGTLAFGAGMGYLVHRGGWRVSASVLLLILLLLPVFLTIRTACRFCYVNYDYATEFLVYAHAGPAVKEAKRQIEELSRRTAGGPNEIKVAYGSDGSTLFQWQLRDYPNAVFYGEQPAREQMDAPVVIAGRQQWDAVAPYMDRDYVNTYVFMWWPMEDYKDLTWARFTHAITDTQTRAALWDIWYNRDYRRYDELTGKTHTLDQWPLRSEFRLYVRRDVASQMWNLGTTGPLEIGPTDPYAEGWQELTARLVFGNQGSEPGRLQSPSGVNIGSDGFVYVADTGNQRIQKFSADGQFVAAWGQNSAVEVEVGLPQGFNDPWDVAVAPDGHIYVADTWNHRIQKLDAGGNPVTAWGLFGQYGPEEEVGESAFYGPRGIAIGSTGQVYVADTGNKRVQVFGPDGQFMSQWGGGGVLEGYLDEPVGITIGPDDEVYVADTWNRRVQVFTSDGVFLRQWSIAGWDTGLPDEKPYLAVDDQGYVYVTDPGHYRVLVFDGSGNYVLSFGQYGLDESSFALPVGISIGPDGSIYVTDAHGGRVLVFDPLF